MASAPKRRRVRKSHQQANSTTQPNQTDDISQLVETCMAAAMPIVQETVRQCILNSRQNDTSQEAATSDPGISTLVDITSADSAVQGPVPQNGQDTHGGPTRTPASLMTTADYLISKSLSEESRSSYKNIFLTYKQFLQDHMDKAANPLVPKLSHLVSYIAHCFTQGLAASTARTHISALSFIFQLGGHQDLTQHFIIKKQLQGYSKTKPSQDARLPITPTILSKIILSLPHVTNSSFIKCLLHAMYVLAFSAFLRVGEITKTGKLNQHFLLVKHINITANPNQGNSIDLTIPHCKHSIRPISLQISRNLENPLLCPVRALQYFMQIRKHASQDEALFSFMDGNPVSRQFFTQNLNNSLTFCGLDTKRYQSHSFRIGAATAAADLGASDIQIQNMGRWKSTAFKKYIRVPVLTL